MITLDTDARGGICLIVNDDGRDVFVQSDWDAPGVARTFGWNLAEVEHSDADGARVACDHSSTDGTVACPECGCGPGAFIRAALDFIEASDGATAEDPGYFD